MLQFRQCLPRGKRNQFVNPNWTIYLINIVERIRNSSPPQLQLVRSQLFSRDCTVACLRPMCVHLAVGGWRCWCGQCLQKLINSFVETNYYTAIPARPFVCLSVQVQKLSLPRDHFQLSCGDRSSLGLGLHSAVWTRFQFNAFSGLL